MSGWDAYTTTHKHLAYEHATRDETPDPHDDAIQQLAADSDDWRTQQETP